MKFSARNQIKVVVKDVTPGKVNSEITMESESGLQLSSIITLSSAKRLGLKSGKKAVAIIKASEVIMGTGKPGKISARNVITGKVSKLTPGVVNGEVVLDAGGCEIVSVITLESIKKLGLKEGKEAYAVIKASNIIIGV